MPFLFHLKYGNRIRPAKPHSYNTEAPSFRILLLPAVPAKKTDGHATRLFFLIFRNMVLRPLLCISLRIRNIRKKFLFIPLILDVIVGKCSMFIIHYIQAVPACILCCAIFVSVFQFFIKNGLVSSVTCRLFRSLPIAASTFARTAASSLFPNA